MEEEAQPPTQPTNEIWYTTTDGNVITPTDTSFWDNIVSNTYENGKGVIKFDGDVTSISNYAFGECTTLESIEIPNSVTSIGEYAFNSCSGLREINIPSSVTTIGDNAFGYCYSWSLSSGPVVNYAGTIEQWNAISKHARWIEGSEVDVVHCSDGDVTL